MTRQGSKYRSITRIHSKIACLAVRAIILLVLLRSGPAGITHAQTPLGSSFTYQGQLRQSGSPANGTFDFEFRLFDASDPQMGTQLATAFESNVIVTNGLFSLLLNFADELFRGDSLWLQILIAPAGSTEFSALDPLQPLTPVPYALFAITAGESETAQNAATLDGLGPSAFLLATGGTVDGSLSVLGQLGIGTASPSAALDVVGTARIRSLGSGAGTSKMVVVDGSGHLETQDIPQSGGLTFISSATGSTSSGTTIPVPGEATLAIVSVTTPALGASVGETGDLMLTRVGKTSARLSGHSGSLNGSVFVLWTGNTLTVSANSNSSINGTIMTSAPVAYFYR